MKSEGLLLLVVVVVATLVIAAAVVFGVAHLLTRIRFDVTGASR